MRSQESATTDAPDPVGSGSLESNQVICFDPNGHTLPQVEIQVTAKQRLEFRVFGAAEAIER